MTHIYLGSPHLSQGGEAVPGQVGERPLYEDRMQWACSCLSGFEWILDLLDFFSSVSLEESIPSYPPL